MNGLFKQLDELFDSVIDILVELQRDELMTPLLDYFKDEEADYMHYLRVLDSAVVNLGRSVQPVWEPFQVSIKPNPIASLPEQFTVSESKVTYVLQKEQSCMDSVHISSSEVVPDSPASPSHPEICSKPHGCKYHHLTLTLTLIIVYFDNSTTKSNNQCSTFRINTNSFNVELHGDHIKTYIHVDIT